MRARAFSRWEAAGAHLLISAAIAAIAVAVILGLWFPGPLFEAAGGLGLLNILVGVDVVLGPLLTLVVFKSGKPGMKFDLAAIGTVQLAALVYGCSVVFLARPAFIVFVKDRFELVRANHIPDEERAKAKPPYSELAIDGPRLAAARMPTDPAEQLRIGITAAAGQDIQTYPQYLVAYDESRREVVAKSLPFERLLTLNASRRPEIERIRERLARPAESIRYLPLRAGKADLAVLVDGKSGDVLEIAGVKPWEY